jgi:L-aminopeptidase/D-esterase-like protein
VLRFYCDLSIDQSAVVLGCSAGTVKSQTARGLEAVRLALGPAHAAGPGRGRAAAGTGAEQPKIPGGRGRD